MIEFSDFLAKLKSRLAPAADSDARGEDETSSRGEGEPAPHEGVELVPRIAVTPYVAVAPAEYHVFGEGEASSELTLSSEVAAAFWVPVSELKSGGRSGTFRMVFAGVEREWPAYPSTHGPIWGLTERILTEFLSLVG